MEANDFIARLKADGSENDWCDVKTAYDEYKHISSGLNGKDKAAFSLNTLCIICRNLDKVPTWKDRVDSKHLVTLSIDCVRETRNSCRPDLVKTLACVYHIHKHVIKLGGVPPEQVLKLSFMPFEFELLLEEYSKTYWNILVDRMTYIERLKTKTSIGKLLPKMTEDILKVVNIYNSVQFCSNIIVFLVKKLHFLYNEKYAKDLQKAYGVIFKNLSMKTDLGSFKKLNDKDILDVYSNFNDCFYVIAENASKMDFKKCVLNTAIRTAITILGHDPELMRCLETFFLNGFYSIFENLSNTTNTENVLNNMLTSCVSMEKNGCEKSLYVTYPFLNQFLRLFIEYIVTNKAENWKEQFNEKIQLSCLNLILYLATKKTAQFVKCDNCKVKSGLHDSLRLLFLIKHLPTTSIAQGINITAILPVYYKLVNLQHKILYELKRLGCGNHEICFRKLQTDIHNTAITLNKASYYEFSIKLFNIYVKIEMRYFKNETELKNISRALYNKSICQLDYQLFEDALKDAFLSLIFSLPDGLGTEKYMGLVMDIKAKALKANTEDCNEEFQLISVLKACEDSLNEKRYGNLKPFLCNVDFSEILKHEFSMYAKLWPSITPIAGVWRSLSDLIKSKPSWVKDEKEDDLLRTLYEIVLETPTVVRTIHNEQFSSIVTELVERFDKEYLDTVELRVVHATLLFLKYEYDLAAANQKYGWKITEPTMDPDTTQAVRTIPQEHEASKRAIQAVDVLRNAAKDIDTVSASVLPLALATWQVSVHQLALQRDTCRALQLAALCCRIARRLEHSEAYVRNASVILSHAAASCPELVDIIGTCTSYYGAVELRTAVTFLCDAAIYYKKIGATGVAARLVQVAQARILEACHKHPDVNLDVAVGRLAEAQLELCRSNNALAAVSGVQRHYLSISNTETKWSSRRLLALELKRRIVDSTLTAACVCRALMLWRRARCTIAAALPVTNAAPLARMYATVVNAHSGDDARTKIDNRLKHILGLQPSYETQQHAKSEATKPHLFTPKHENLEVMLENMVFKKTKTSPSPCTSVFAYKTPDFFHHKSNCDCYACDNPSVFLIACLTSGLEASMYYRAKETDIATNYFDGTIKSFAYAENKLRGYFKNCRSKYDGFIVDMVERLISDDFKSIQIEILIEAAFFELTQQNHSKADDFIVRIHEIVQEMTKVDPYLRNDVMNLMTTAAQLRKSVTKPVETSLELDFEGLRLSPGEPPKTPVTKPSQPPKLTKNIVKNDELPTKRKVIKLNLDEDDKEKEKEAPKTRSKRSEFKIPVPITSKPVLENITPRRKPDILVTKPVDDVIKTPLEKTEFHTPISTPAEQFFTPMTSLRTYSKKSLRHNIVKNLEAEFSTPKADKENSTLNSDSLLEIPKSVRATRSKVDKHKLKRAVSPGKLEKERTSRM